MEYNKEKEYTDFLREVSTLTHDLNNSLAALRGFTEILNSDLIDGTPQKIHASKALFAAEEALTHVSVMQKSVQRMRAKM